MRACAFGLGVLPDGLGQFRLAQHWWWWRRPAHRILPQRFANGTRLQLDLGDRTQALAYLTRRYCDDLIEQIVSRLPPDGTFLDIGANVGMVSFQVAHRRPDARIVAFEPNPLAVDGWLRNRRLSPASSATLEQCAVGDRVATLRLASPRTDLGAGVVAQDESGVEVPATALDVYCAEHDVERVDVMKVDVEGFEPEVLAGARELLAAGAIRALIVELNDGHFARRGSSRGALIAWLEQVGMLPCGPVDADDVVFAPAPPLH